MNLSLLLVAAAEEAAQGGLGGPFTVEPGLVIWTWIVFAVLFFLLRKYAWPPIVRLTEEREKKIAAQLGDAERLNREAQAALDEHKRLLAGAKDDALALINEAKGLAHKEREQILAKAQDEHEHILVRARREIEAERDRALAELRREAVDLSLAAAAKLIEQRLDSAADRKIVEDYIGALGVPGR
ncbi:MAG: F0F1 ATP synthase subunit B [Gemmatimonadales bacterium]|jgi:F-type H+-transporting ATPase subunit b|nr:F0F1 ATP synthase subunit B [Gemmatimonadales bacterium]